MTESLRTLQAKHSKELENVNGGSIGVGGTTFPQTVVIMTGARVVVAGVDGPAKAHSHHATPCYCDLKGSR